MCLEFANLCVMLNQSKRTRRMDLLSILFILFLSPTRSGNKNDKFVMIHLFPLCMFASLLKALCCFGATFICLAMNFTYLFRPFSFASCLPIIYISLSLSLCCQCVTADSQRERNRNDGTLCSMVLVQSNLLRFETFIWRPQSSAQPT